MHTAAKTSLLEPHRVHRSGISRQINVFALKNSEACLLPPHHHHHPRMGISSRTPIHNTLGEKMGTLRKHEKHDGGPAGRNGRQLTLCSRAGSLLEALTHFLTPLFSETSTRNHFLLILCTAPRAKHSTDGLNAPPFPFLSFPSCR